MPRNHNPLCIQLCIVHRQVLAAKDGLEKLPTIVRPNLYAAENTSFHKAALHLTDCVGVHECLASVCRRVEVVLHLIQLLLLFCC